MLGSASPLNWLFIIRFVAAVAMTFGLLLYASGRTLIEGMINGRPPIRYLELTAIGILAVMALTAGLSARLKSPRLDRAARWGVPAVWVVVNTLLIRAFTGTLLPKVITVPLFVLASLWVVWSAWMFYRPTPWRVRIGGLAVCLMFLAAFVGLLRVDGIAGEFQVEFTWRARPVPDHGSELPLAISESSPTGTDLNQIGPDDYPQFLGPHRTGVLEIVDLSPDWEATPPREVWRRPVGAGWSSFAIVGDFAATQEQRGSRECVVCYRVSDGEPVWLHTDETRFDQNVGGPGPRATPTIADGRVYAVGGTGLLTCLEGETGQPRWSVDILEDNRGHPIEHGVCGSPLVTGELVIVAPTGIPDACLAAYDRMTGKRVWRGGRHRASYGSPALVDMAGMPQVLLVTADGIEGNDLQTGAPLWSYTWTADLRVNCSQPIVVDANAGRILFCTGYGKGSVLLAIVPDAGSAWRADPVWTSPGEMKTKFTTAVLYNGYVYGLDDGILACLDLKSGRRLWKGGRYQHGQILLAGDLLIVQAEPGDVYLVRPDPKKLIELGKIAALSHKTWNNPALAGRMLLVRNDQEAACYELPAARSDEGSQPESSPAGTGN